MAREGSPAPDRLRAAEVVATLCLATDLGMALPFEHGLQTTLIASRLAQRLGVDHEAEKQAYYVSFMAHAGCTTDAELAAATFGSPLVENLHPVIYGSESQRFSGILRALPDGDRSGPVRAIQAVRRLPRAARGQRPHFAAACEVIQRLGIDFGLPRDVTDPLLHLYERWDGKGVLGRSKGEEMPLPVRIAIVAIDAAFQRRLLGDTEEVARIIRERAGGAFDPEIANCLADHADEILAPGEGSIWDEVLEREPGLPLAIEGEAVDRALVAMAGFTDLVSPYFTGHSTGVAHLAAAAAERCRIDAEEVPAVRRAGLVHELGRVAVHPKLWAKDGPLTADEWEQVRLHPYQTERVLSPSPFFAALAPTAAAHHERLDGSGYHRRASGAEIPMPARVLAAADAYHAMCQPRAHREALAPEDAAAELGREASEGRLDPDAVTAVIEAAGERAPKLERPAGLTEREALVVALLARGLMTKQVARKLEISAKTADTHIQNAYRKIGVSTRAGATLFAIEHGLVAWADLPQTGVPAG
jgi:HD-GYP domain-containing protein (c-di-GMP phosphodiesterase class II)